MEKLNTNVLVIGKSGVGKSSLLNYLFGREIQETGAGKPVTKEGIFPFEYEYDSKFHITIYDTWGLEPDKADRWNKLIMDEVRKHEKQDIHEWFNTILFCISAASTKAEDFEVNIINSLLKEKNHIVVAITHSESASDKSADMIKQRLLRDTKLQEQDIVFVNNVEKKLIGKKVHRFGKEQIFISIIRNLWRTFKSKVPYRVQKIIYGEFEEEKQKLHKLIPSRLLLFGRGKKIDEFEREVNLEFQEFVSRITNRINREFENAMIYYNALSNQYSDIGTLLNKDEIIYNPDFKFDALEDFRKEVENVVRSIREKIREINRLMYENISKKVLMDLGMAIKNCFTSSKDVQKELHNVIDKYLQEAKECMQQKVGVIEEKIKEKDIESIYENQLKQIRFQ